ncbi:hypothetical protein BH18ACT15_BH18ACT15_12990 [soil metagenome]
MTKMIQIRHVPDDVHRRLKATAAAQGVSLSDYLLREVSRVANQPTLDELRARIKTAGRVQPPEDSAAEVRSVRDST